MSDPIFTPDEIVPSRVDLGEQERRIDEQERITRAKIVEGVILVKTDPNRKVETTYPERMEPYPGAAKLQPNPDVIKRKRAKRQREDKERRKLMIEFARGMAEGLQYAIDIVGEQLLETSERVEQNLLDSTEGILELAKIRIRLKRTRDSWRKKADA